MIRIQKEDLVAKITLSRPDVRNALNSSIISRLTNELKDLENDENVRVITITGEGTAFSAGADLNWLKDITNFTYEQNYNDSKNFVELLNTIQHHNRPIISIVNGAAVGGGTGIALASDIVIAAENALFGVSEVAIGIVPAAIIKLLKNKLGDTKSREFLITGKRLTAEMALNMGMINYVVAKTKLNEKVDEIVRPILRNGPKAVSKVKEMINTVDNLKQDKLDDYIAKTIAELRKSDEGQEGINSFLEKRKPNWVNLS